jgi:hypothetical protein
MEGFRGLVKRCCMQSRDPYEIKRTCGTYAPHFFAQIMFQFDKITALNIDKLGGFRHYCPVIRALDPAPNTHEAELMKCHILFTTLLLMTSVPAQANVVERACNGSNRQAATRSLCSCVGSVASASLSRSEQRDAARFFGDPQRAQVMRTSNRSRDEQFWQRYVAFGAAVEASCS